MGSVGKICKRGDGEYDWEIGNFPSLEDGPMYYSPTFSFKNCVYRIGCSKLIAPDGIKYVLLGLVITDSQASVSVRYSFGIKTTEGETLELFSSKTHREGRFIACDDVKCVFETALFLRKKDQTMPRGTLTIIATLKDTEGSFLGTTKDSSVQTEDDENSEILEETDTKAVKIQRVDSEKDESLENTGFKKVVQDIAKLWENGENSDVLIKVKGTEFKAHKTILAARVPALGAMFHHDTTEKDSGEVTIDDCEPPVFEQLLHFVYTGAPRSLTAENAPALYVVADKYLVDEVKALCVQCMKDTVWLNNFCDIVTISLMYKEEELLEVAVDFLSKHVVDVMKTVEWQLFLREHLTWGNELLIRGLERQARNVEGKSDPSGI